MKLCTCNYCGGIFEDMNPLTNAKEYPSDPNILPLIKLFVETSKPETGYWGCPVCCTDGYLKDGLGITDYNPDNAEPGEVCTEDDFIEAAKGNLRYALLLRQRVSWQWPSTLVEEDLIEGEIEEVNGTYVFIDQDNLPDPETKVFRAMEGGTDGG